MLEISQQIISYMQYLAMKNTGKPKISIQLIEEQIENDLIFSKPY